MPFSVTFSLGNRTNLLVVEMLSSLDAGQGKEERRLLLGQEAQIWFTSGS